MTLTNLAALRLKQGGSAAEAEALYKRATIAKPHDATAWFNLGVMLKRQPGRVPEAEASLRKALKIQPGDPEMTLHLAEVLFQVKFLRLRPLNMRCPAIALWLLWLLARFAPAPRSTAMLRSAFYSFTLQTIPPVLPVHDLRPTLIGAWRLCGCRAALSARA